MKLLPIFLLFALLILVRAYDFDAEDDAFVEMGDTGTLEGKSGSTSPEGWQWDDMATRSINPCSEVQGFCASDASAHMGATTLELFDAQCRSDNVLPEDRFELLAKPQQFSKVVAQMRRMWQTPLVGIHEGWAIQALFTSAWAKYGYAVVTRDAIEQLRPLLEIVGHKWVDPYAGTGYFAMQLQNILGVKVDAYDAYPKLHQWVTVASLAAQSVDYTNYDVFVLAYPCVYNTCWDGLLDFTDQSKGRHVIYMGEPRGNCCGASGTWQHLCAYYKLVTAIPIEAGLPGSFNYLAVYERRDLSQPIVSLCKNGACDDLPNAEAMKEFDICG